MILLIPLGQKLLQHIGADCLIQGLFEDHSLSQQVLHLSNHHNIVTVGQHIQHSVPLAQDIMHRLQNNMQALRWLSKAEWRNVEHHKKQQGNMSAAAHSHGLQHIMPVITKSCTTCVGHISTMNSCSAGKQMGTSIYTTARIVTTEVPGTLYSKHMSKHMNITRFSSAIQLYTSFKGLRHDLS